MKLLDLNFHRKFLRGNYHNTDSLFDINFNFTVELHVNRLVRWLQIDYKHYIRWCLFHCLLHINHIPICFIKQIFGCKYVIALKAIVRLEWLLYMLYIRLEWLYIFDVGIISFRFFKCYSVVELVRSCYFLWQSQLKWNKAGGVCTTNYTNQFVRFVFDNCDHNIESIFDTLHCTNGMITKVKSTRDHLPYMELKMFLKINLLLWKENGPFNHRREILLL